VRRKGDEGRVVPVHSGIVDGRKFPSGKATIKRKPAAACWISTAKQGRRHGWSGSHAAAASADCTPLLVSAQRHGGPRRTSGNAALAPFGMPGMSWLPD
jgi:hypothetical protein